MLTEHLKELQAAKAKVAELEMKIAAERRKGLAALPAQFGFADMNAFILALRATHGRRRPRISEETRAQVKQLLAAGKTGAEIAAATGISRPSIQAIKQSLGLVKARKPAGDRAAKQQHPSPPAPTAACGGGFRGSSSKRDGPRRGRCG
ncbi:MAG: helix-turn-helix domain-containing protein [Verrucomicrobiota bacterium]